ncbi:hypothetical protein BIY24_13910 [Halobacteriovorax marinus]|uniref:serine hydrolase n=1 Tax=Halobacteriovorax marinus TaxID=97084 RepID=UPI000BC36456|nr:serine hydrolase [Halobacteriovorax marinus]ATH09002.1 hypothetical protein BIY24_13910 [Halobacteriovorax marinus]
MQDIQKIIENLMPKQHFDCVAVGVIDFKAKNYESLEWHGGEFVNKSGKYFFDLASLTKPLTLASTYLTSPKKFNNEMLLLLNHRGSLTSGGRISPSQWRSYIKSFQVKEAPTLYSDYSALRAMLEIEDTFKRELYEICSDYFDEEMFHWTELEDPLRSPVTGFRHGKKIQGEVHDDNAFYLKEKVSHAGLFASIDGLCKSLLNLDSKYSLLDFMDGAFKNTSFDRFLYGWDTVSDPQNSLAGRGCSSSTFGHLGFTGTSIWIDTQKSRGSVILTNATQNYWYDRKGLTELRKELGSSIWSK